MSNRPKLMPGLDFLIKAFTDLSTCRSLGFQAGPIPWSAMDRYAQRNRITDFDEFSEILSAMDRAYLDHVSKKCQT